jgi:AraC-like DNA-binding protein
VRYAARNQTGKGFWVLFFKKEHSSLFGSICMNYERRSSTEIHNEGVNAGRTICVAPPLALAGDLFGYADYWKTTGSFTTRRELPHAEGVLIFNLGAPIAITGGDGNVLHLGAGEAFFAGAHVRPALSHSIGAQAGIHVFLPLVTLRRLLGAPMRAFVDRVMPLDAALGAEARALGQALGECGTGEERVMKLDNALGRRLHAAGTLDPQQAHAVRLLRRRPDRDIADIARDIGWSRKHLADRVRDAVGVGPRCFRRLLRFQALTRAVGNGAGQPNWAALALDAGYCDQSHMIREFREFSGLTPTAYIARRRPDGGLPEA